MVEEKRMLVNLILTRKKNWIGLILRDEVLLRDVTEGRMMGKRDRGRPRTKMLDELVAIGTYKKLKRRFQCRQK